MSRLKKSRRLHQSEKSRVARLLAALVLCSVASLASVRAQPAARAWVTILSTTDIHGNIYPLDYYTDRPDARGLARVSTVVRQARRENPNLLLVDSGDTIQGTPLAYYHNKKNNTPPDPVMLSMNAMRFDAMAVGNHEYNFGLRVLEKARREAAFPWLSANTYRKGTDETYHRPYVVKEVGGVRVGILGLTTPGVPFWENAENYAGLEFREPVAEAKKWVAVLRNKEKVDLVVVAMHMGLERDLRTGEPTPGQVANENAALAVAWRVAGVDVILMGHTHREVPSLVVNSNFVREWLQLGAQDETQAESPRYVNAVLLTQANYWARHVARVDVYFEKHAEGRWRVAHRQARTIPVEGVADDPEILKLAEPYHRETQAWLNSRVAESAKELTAADARLRDTAILDLVQRVQLETGKADVSMAASFNPQARIPAGPVTVRDIASLYVYENTLVVIEVTGRQLKDALEHSARYFRAYEPGKSPAELVDEKIPGYNFDIAEGVAYDLDISRPVGSRVLNLSFKGRPVRPEQKFRLATNNYRVNGGGGYTMYAGAPVLYRSSEEIRELIIAWAERRKQIPTEPTMNWRLLPEAARTR
ncbi:MAG TPA: bifunctional UDP-sugar hydrolase/5'-nucleotidase [Pyrinomonadaceae bacterium]|nr:bifunctional UDP-sugar hydrolase/5'-nucleotidase [Pyrinomonadaceae bacterium]